VNPDADILTMRPGLAGVRTRVALVSGAYFGLPPNAPICPAGDCIDNPVIQTISALPSGEHAPNTLITQSAVSALGMQAVPVGWIIQSPTTLTAAQINAARQGALAVGATIETKSGQLSLGEISEYSTIGGIVVALGVLAMTVGLIRGETTGDLRTLTAAGASARIRRALTGVTAGALALLGAVLGTVAGFLAALAFAHSSIGGTFGNLPWIDIALLVVGMPLVAAAAGWLLGGRGLAPRRPRAHRRRPPGLGVNPQDNSKKCPAPRLSARARPARPLSPTPATPNATCHLRQRHQTPPVAYASDTKRHLSSTPATPNATCRLRQRHH
jgi:putative ABC transport system permease protein